MSINWYPGHMAKTRRLMLDDMRNVDMVCEILDARIPLASRNPDLERISSGKRRMIVLNRADQADPELTVRWKDFFRKSGYTVIETDSQRGGFLPEFTSAAKQCCRELIERNEAKGLSGRRIRIMIFGVPNVGKSSFINRLLGKKSAIAADKPGVTRKKQWFSLPGGFDFMDTPGMLWPKIDDDETGFRLAFTGTIRDEILDLEELACRLVLTLNKTAPGAMDARYGVDIDAILRPKYYESELAGAYRALEAMALARSMVISGGQADVGRFSRVLLDEFRSGKLGKITLELPPE